MSALAPRRGGALVALVLLGVLAPAQEPRFRPVPEAPRPATPAPESERAPGPEAPDPQDPVEALFTRLADWPARKAQDAAITLAGLGEGVRDRLLRGLTAKDWRVQAASAFSLAEMGEKSAVPHLTVAVADETNRMAMPELAEALVRLDPEEGPARVLPLVGARSGRVRKAAREALPKPLPDRHLPAVLKLVEARQSHLRVSGLELLGTVPSAGAHPAFLDALADPQARVAHVAAVHLGDVAPEEVVPALLRVARTAPLRQAGYAMLALVREEDRRGIARIPEIGVICDRAQQFVRGRDPFQRAVGAILLANLSYRSEQLALRELADTHLMPLLLDAVAGGEFFADYGSIEDLTWRKMELLTGQEYGANARAWAEYWTRVRDDFRARRRLTRVSAADLARAQLLWTRSQPGRPLETVRFSGEGLLAEGPVPPGTLLLDAASAELLAATLQESGFFQAATEGLRFDPDAQRSELRVQLEGGVLQHARAVQGPDCADQAPVLAALEQVRERLAWQHYAPLTTPEERSAWLATEGAWFAKTDDAAARRGRLLELALAGYPVAGTAGRRCALDLFEAAPEGFAIQHRDRWIELLEVERGDTVELARLVRLLHGQPGLEVQRAVVGRLGAFETGRGAVALVTWMEAATREQVLESSKDPKASVRRMALLALRGHSEVAERLLEALEDAEFSVREAALEAMATVSDPRVRPMLEAVLEHEEQGLRVRAIEAYAVVVGDAAVPRLRTFIREGDDRERWVAVRSLVRARGPRATKALFHLLKEDWSLDLHRSAIDGLVEMDSEQADQFLVEALTLLEDPSRQAFVVEALPRALGQAAVPHLTPLFGHQDEDLRRLAILEVGRLGDPVARAPLVGLLEALEGDAAAERVLEGLTFFQTEDRSAPRRHIAHREFGERFGALSRREWFLRAASEEGVVLDAAIDWLGDEALPIQAAKAVAPLLRKGRRSLQLAVDRALLRTSELPLAPLPELPTSFEINDRATAYEFWLRNAATDR